MDTKREGKEIVKLWLKGEFLLRCLLPLNPPSRLVTSNLKKVISYVKAKHSSEFPQISYNTWLYVARQKLCMNDELAKTYFRLMFDAVPQHSDESKNLMDHILDGSIDPKLMSNLLVPLIPFTLLLFIQQANRKDLRNSMKAPDRYPGPDTSFSESTIYTYGSKENIELLTLEFVKDHLRSLLELVVLAEQNVKDYRNTEISKRTISVNSLSHMDVIFEGSVFIKTDCEKKPVMTFSKLAKISFLKQAYQNEIEIRTLENFLRTKLQTDVFVIASPSEVSNQQTFAEGDEFSPLSSAEFASNKPKILHNSKTSPDSHKIVTFSGISKTTVVKSNDVLNDSICHIFKCQNAHLYVMSPMRCLIIRKCKGTTIFASPVSDVLRVQYCRDVTIIGVCRSLIISWCQRCTFHVKTSTNPVILGSSNEDIVFAPFHSDYPSLEAEMSHYSLPVSPDFWNKPIYFTNGDTEEQPNSDKRSCWSLLNPERFFPFYLPFKFAASNGKVPGGLPLEYKLAVERREKMMKEWHELAADLSDEAKAQLKRIVQDRFSSWLESEGRKTELDQLRKLQFLQQKKNRNKTLLT